MKILLTDKKRFTKQVLSMGNLSVISNFQDHDFLRLYVSNQIIITLFSDLIDHDELIFVFSYLCKLSSTRGKRAIIEKLSVVQDDITGYLSKPSLLAWRKLLRRLPKCISRLKSLRNFSSLPAVKQAEIVRLLMTLTSLRRLFTVN